MYTLFETTGFCNNEKDFFAGKHHCLLEIKGDLQRKRDKPGELNV